MSEIKIFDISDEGDDIDSEYQLPSKLKLSDVKEINVKKISKYGIPVCHKNPYIDNEKSNPNGVWIEFDNDTYVINKSKSKFRVPASHRVYIIGIYTSFYAAVNKDTSDATLILDPYFKKTNNITPRAVRPSIVLLKDIKFKSIIDDINQSLTFNDINSLKIGDITTGNSNTTGSKKTRKAKKIELLGFSKLFKSGLTYSDAGIFGLWNILDGMNINPNIKRDVTPMIDTMVESFSIRNLDKQKSNLKLARLDRFSNDMKLGNFGKLDKKNAELVHKKYNTFKTKEDKFLMNIDTIDDTDALVAINKLREQITNFVSRGAVVIAYKEVDKLFKIPTNVTDMKELIPTDDKTKQKLLCPHIVDHSKRLINDTKSSDFVILQSIAKHWAGDIAMDYKFYCGTCGELIMNEDIDMLNINSMTADSYGKVEKDNIWSETYNAAIRSFPLIKFKTPINPSKIATHIANILHNQLSVEEAIIQKNETLSVFEIQNITSVYIVCYVFALFSHYMFSDPDQYKWNIKLKNGNKKPHAKRDEDTLLKISFALIESTRRYILKEVKDHINNDKLGMIISSAYSYVKNGYVEDLEVLDEGSVNKLHTQSFISHDPLWELMRVSAVITKKKMISTDEYTKFLPDIKNVSEYVKSRDEYYLDKKHTSKNVFPELFEYMLFINEYKSPETSAEFNTYLEKYKPNKKFTKYMFQFLQPFVEHKFMRGITPDIEIFTSDINCIDGKRHKFINDICRKCGNKYKSAPNRAIFNATKLRDKIDLFYKKYAKNCPAKDIGPHDWKYAKNGLVKDNIPCGSCKMFIDFSETKDVKFYKKWGKTLKKTLPSVVILPPRKNFEIKTKDVDWKNTNMNLLKISKITLPKYTNNMWKNIGLFEGNSYKEIKSGKSDPYADMYKKQDVKITTRGGAMFMGRMEETKNIPNKKRTRYGKDVHINNILNYIQIVFQTYKFITATHINHPNQHLVDMSEKIPMADKKHLPPLYDDFWETYRNIKDQHNAVNYCQNALATSLLRIYDLSKKEITWGSHKRKVGSPTGKVFKELFTMMISDIFEKEQMSSKLEIQKKKVLAEFQITDLESNHADSFNAELQVAKNSALDAGEDDAFDSNPFSMEGTSMNEDDTDNIDIDQGFDAHD